MILYTIGHSNLTAQEFLDLLRRHGVVALVDVRSAPYSRYVPHFSKEPLEALLRVSGIDYRYAGEWLGGQPKDQSVYKQEALPDDGTKRQQYRKLVDYLAVMQRDWYQKAIFRLLDIVREAEGRGNVVILCSEGNPHECHRHHLITRSLLDSRVRVVDVPVEVRHIHTDGKVETVNPAEFEDKPEQRRLL
jgi:uncharacterized protein (DUF488 family)